MFVFDLCSNFEIFSVFFIFYLFFFFLCLLFSRFDYKYMMLFWWRSVTWGLSGSISSVYFSHSTNWTWRRAEICFKINTIHYSMVSLIGFVLTLILIHTTSAPSALIISLRAETEQIIFVHPEIYLVFFCLYLFLCWLFLVLLKEKQG